MAQRPGARPIHSTEAAAKRTRARRQQTKAARPIDRRCAVSNLALLVFRKPRAAPGPPHRLTMMQSPDEQRSAIARLRRIRGQAETLERAASEGAAAAPLLQQLTAASGARDAAAVKAALNPLHGSCVKPRPRPVFVP